jgi:hypothetical protein
MKTEIWRVIPELDGYYKASNLGRIKRVDSNRILKCNDNGHGYRYIKLCILNQRKNHYVHRLVASTFIPKEKNKIEVNHKNAIKSDNRVSNLEWVSIQQNRDHAVKNGLVAHGEKSSNSVLTEKQVVEILDIFHKNPKSNKTHIGRRFGVNDTAIIKILRGMRWTRVFDKWIEDKKINAKEFTDTTRIYKVCVK